ncbi:hypothetical protein [Paenibacillus sp. UNC451MF]|uniref:hypothetical protein n=1 Tax=Paenibacillus sp. UNC451MF TaxID=1449063 RepID=UPI00048ED1A7|nr:hypothetical protein [Paenibacillus sp. UNC451MF]
MKECIVEGCQRLVKARNLCSMHHQRLLRTGSPDMVRKKSKKEPKQCQWINCCRDAVSKGYCAKHYYIHKTLNKAANAVKVEIER